MNYDNNNNDDNNNKITLFSCCEQIFRKKSIACTSIKTN